jgi:hypothetical protein
MKENEAFVIRNGGGRPAPEDVIRSLTLIQILSEVKELKIVHHTGSSLEEKFGGDAAQVSDVFFFDLDCVFTDEDIRAHRV